MATQPTNLPVPSESARDLKFNAGKIDEFVTSREQKYIDRFGGGHYTIEGMRQVAQQAISAFGYITMDSFQNGATLTLPNQVLRWKLPDGDGEYYRWDGAFPKVVPAASTPDSTGGIGAGKWLSVGDASLRAELAQPDGSSMIGNGIGTVSDALTYITPEQFAEQYPGETNWAVMINKAYEYARENGKTVLLANVYHIRTSIIHYDGVRVINSGKIICDPAGDYSVLTPSGFQDKAAYVITTKDGRQTSRKGTTVDGLYIANTENEDPEHYNDEHVNAKGLLVTDIAGLNASDIKVFGHLGGVDIGGESGRGYEIFIKGCTSWIYNWVDSNIAGFTCNVSDSTFYDVITTAFGIGIHIKRGSNVFFNPHPWGYPLTADNLYPNRQTKILFYVEGGGNSMYRPYADTVSKIDASKVADLENGGYAFYFSNWGNTCIDSYVTASSEEMSSDLVLAHFAGDANDNLFDLRALTQPSKFLTTRFTYDEPAALFRNVISGRSGLGDYLNLSGNSSISAAGVTSSGTYLIRRSGGFADVLFQLSVTATTSPTGEMSVPLPLGLSFYYGSTTSMITRGCLKLPSDSIDVIAVSNGGKIEFYSINQTGTRTKLTATDIRNGNLEFMIRGHISN